MYGGVTDGLIIFREPVTDPDEISKMEREMMEALKEKVWADVGGWSGEGVWSAVRRPPLERPHFRGGICIHIGDHLKCPQYSGTCSDRPPTTAGP